MAKVQKVEDLIAWQKAEALARWFKEHLGIGTEDPPPAQ